MVDKEIERSNVNNFNLTINGVELRQTPNGRGIFSTKELPQHNAFASIPFGSIVNRQNLKESSPISAFLEQHKQLDEQTSLIVYFIYCRIHRVDGFGDGTNPTSSCSTFLSFSSSDIRNSRDQQLIMDYFAYQKQVREEFTELYAILKKHPNLFPGETTVEQYWKIFMEASDMISTRGFGYGMKETAIIPFFDCLNHRYGDTVRLMLVNQEFETDPAKYDVWKQQNPYSKDYEFISAKYDLSLIGIYSQPNWCQQQACSSDNQSEDQQTVCPLQAIPPYTHIVLCTDSPVTPNEQLFLHYGCRNNGYLLRWYGFAVEDNPYDSVRVFFSEMTETVRFDPIERPATEVKFKRRRLCLGMLAWARRYYYEGYYKTNGRLLWTVPKNAKYEEYILQKCLSRLKNNQPSVHNNYSYQARFIHVYQKQQLKIYQNQIKIVQQVFEWVKQSKIEESAQYSKDIAVYCRSFIVSILHKP